MSLQYANNVAVSNYVSLLCVIVVYIPSTHGRRYLKGIWLALGLCAGACQVRKKLVGTPNNAYVVIPVVMLVWIHHVPVGYVGVRTSYLDYLQFCFPGSLNLAKSMVITSFTLISIPSSLQHVTASALF